MRTNGSYLESISKYDSLISQTPQNSKYVPHIYKDLGRIYSEVSAYEKSVQYLLSALELFYKQKDTISLILTLNSIGNVYRKWNHSKIGLHYYNKALDLSLKKNYDKQQATILNNIGLFHLEMKSDSALLYFKRSIKVKQQINDPQSLSITYLNIGEVFYKRNQLDSAEAYYLTSYKLKQAVNEQVGLAILGNNLAELYLNQGNYELAEKYLNESYAISSKLGLLESLAKNHEVRSQYHQTLGQPNKALQHFKDFKLLQDSILDIEKTRALTEMQVRFETEQKEQALVISEKENETKALLLNQQRIIIISLIIGAILFLALAIVLYQRYLVRKRSNDRIKMLMRELHHRVENNFNVLASILGLQSMQSESSEARQIAKEGESRLHAMNLLHKKLYWEDEMATIPMDKYISEVVRQAQSVYARQEVANHLDLQPIKLDVSKAIPLGLILNELITNSYKHAFSNHDSPELTVKLTKESNHVAIELTDNGIGIEKTQGSKVNTSFGMKLIETLCKQIKSDISQLKVEGTGYRIVMPV